MSRSTSELRVRLAPLNRFKPSSKIFYRPFQGGISFVGLLCLICLVFGMSLWASVYLCLVVTSWERADLLALVWGVQLWVCHFPIVSWVRCGTWLYRFLIFAPLLTLPILSYSSRYIEVELTSSCLLSEKDNMTSLIIKQKQICNKFDLWLQHGVAECRMPF